MFVLFYKPPCGAWYVHSHKMYPSKSAARAAAEKFLPSGTDISIVPCGHDTLEYYAEKV